MSSQGSRLTQIQMRYQQKQMHEIASKKSDTYDDTQKLLTSSLGAGKVRAMFDERRHRITAGIDKSYLLEPITVETKTSISKQNRTIAPPSRPTRYEQKMSNYSKVIVPPLQNRTLMNNDVNGNNQFSLIDEPLNRTFGGGELAKVPRTTTTKTVITRKLTPTVLPTSQPLRNVTYQKTSPSRSNKSENNGNSSSSSARSMLSPKEASNGQTRAAPVLKTRGLTSTSKKENSPQTSFDETDAPVPEGLTRCGICKRNFTDDRIEKHQVICQKNVTKKRKVYDASKKRVQGTEAETYNKKPISAARAPKQSNAITPKPNNWRSKHEDFIRTIRAAKEMQAYVAKGGKISDLPPPPPSENLDYVQCPHCSRRFNEGAASRHIPLCKNMQHNKPKAKSSTAGKPKSLVKR